MSNKKTKHSSSKSPVKNMKNRNQQFTLNANHAIPAARFQDDDEGLGRQLAFDVNVEMTPVLTSARKKDKPKQKVDATHVLLGMANLNIGGVSTPTKVSVLPDKVSSTTTEDVKRSGQKKTKKNKVDEDEEWVEPEESETESEQESVSTDAFYDAEEHDELDWGLKNSDDDSESDEDDSNNYRTPREDPYSPEKAKGTIEYTIHDSKEGSTKSIRRCSRLSFGSPSGRLSFGSTSVGRPSFGSPMKKH